MRCIQACCSVLKIQADFLRLASGLRRRSLTNQREAVVVAALRGRRRVTLYTHPTPLIAVRERGQIHCALWWEGPCLETRTEHRLLPVTASPCCIYEVTMALIIPAAAPCFLCPWNFFVRPFFYLPFMHYARCKLQMYGSFPFSEIPKVSVARTQMCINLPLIFWSLRRKRNLEEGGTC